MTKNILQNITISPERNAVQALFLDDLYGRALIEVLGEYQNGEKRYADAVAWGLNKVASYRNAVALNCRPKELPFEGYTDDFEEFATYPEILAKPKWTIQASFAPSDVRLVWSVEGNASNGKICARETPEVFARYLNKGSIGNGVVAVTYLPIIGNDYPNVLRLMAAARRKLHMNSPSDAMVLLADRFLAEGVTEEQVAQMFGCSGIRVVWKADVDARAAELRKTRH